VVRCAVEQISSYTSSERGEHLANISFGSHPRSLEAGPGKLLLPWVRRKAENDQLVFSFNREPHSAVSANPSSFSSDRNGPGTDVRDKDS